MIVIKCCKDCKERHLHCHSTCKKYIYERKELDKANAFVRKDDDYKGYRYDQNRRYERRMLNKGKSFKIKSSQ